MSERKTCDCNECADCLRESLADWMTSTAKMSDRLEGTAEVGRSIAKRRSVSPDLSDSAELPLLLAATK